MPRVYASLGSNIERERNIQSALDALNARFGQLAVSSVYETPAEGFAGEDFHNLVVAFDTDEPPEALKRGFQALEAAHGRERGENKFAPRTLDIDLILYSDRVAAEPDLTLPHPDIRRYAFVLEPLLELDPTLRLPDTGEAIADLWHAAVASGHMRPGRRVGLAMEL